MSILVLLRLILFSYIETFYFLLIYLFYNYVSIFYFLGNLYIHIKCNAPLNGFIARYMA